MSTPDEQVGEQIVSRLREKHLLSDAKLGKLKADLVAGAISADDWVLAFDTDRAKEQAPK